MTLPMQEQETIICFDRSTDTMTVYTANPNEIARLEKLPAYKKIKEDKNGGKVIAATFEADKHLLTLRSKRLKRNLTDEQRTAISERMKRRHAGKS